jgi:hypothetical protein
MTTEEIVESVGEHLFSDEDANVFAVLDGASAPGLLDKLYGLTPEFLLPVPRRDRARHGRSRALSRFSSSVSLSFTSWVIGQGWGSHYGIFAATGRTFAQCAGTSSSPFPDSLR